jgi:putative peptidoglycan lipid II flippase
LFLSLFAVLSSLLYALRKFAWPAFATFFFNLTIVITTLGLEERFGITAAALGWLLGALIQLLLQGWGLRGLGWRLQAVLWHPAIRTIILLYTPVMASLALDVLVNRPISYNLASRTGEGSIAYMDWATTLREFPHGLVATAISIAVLPTLARQAAERTTQEEFKQTLAFGLRLTLALIIPATIGLLVLATPIVSLIFEHGAFTNTDTLLTSLALRLYMIGLPFASLDLLLVFAFYARQDTLTPAMIGVVSLVAYMVVAIVLLPQYSFFALMIADSVKHLIHAGVCAWLLMRRIGGLRGHHLLQTALLSTLAAAIMGLVVTGLLILLRPYLEPHTTLNEMLLVVGAGLPGVILYFLLANFLGIKEIQLFFQKVTSRLYNRAHD